jgi:hypothetical protein
LAVATRAQMKDLSADGHDDETRAERGLRGVR